MLTRISVVLFCLICLCALCVPQADLARRERAGASQSPAEEILLNCALFTAGNDEEFYKTVSKVKGLIALAKIYLETGQKAKALDTLSQALQMAGVKDPETLKKSMLKNSEDYFVASIVSIYAKAGQPDRALDYVYKIEEPSDRAKILARTASDLLESGQREKVSELLSQALKLLKPDADERGALSEIATTYAKIGECDTALKAAERILDLWEYSKASTLSAVAAECAKAGRKDKASRIISRALQTANSIKGEGASKEVDLSLKAQALAEIASAYVDLGEADKVTSILPRAVQIARTLEADNVALEDDSRCVRESRTFRAGYRDCQLY